MYKDCVIYGPYTRKDGRKHVIIVYKDGRRKTMSYPKFLVEKRNGYHLSTDTTIDHIDTDFTNNDENNLRVINRKQHIKEDVKRLKEQRFTCPECNVVFYISGRRLHNAIENRKKGKTGPFCSKSCAGKYGRKIQNGKLPIPIVYIIPEYTTIKISLSLREEISEVEAAKTGKP